MGTCYSHLSPDERIRIERLHCEQGLSVRGTAGLVGRDKATVSRELKRGLWCICLMVCVPVCRGVVDRVAGEKLTM